MMEKLKNLTERIVGSENAQRVKSRPTEISELALQKIMEFARGVLEIVEERDIGLPAFREDTILRQERFEPPEWGRPLEAQLETLMTYLPSLKPDLAYFEKRKSDESPEKTHKVLIPKLSYLGEENNVENPYAEIGVLVEQVCAFLAQQRDGQFTHYRRGALGPDRIRCIQQIVDVRKKLERESQGDVLVLDVDMGNRYAGWTPRRARSNSLIKKNQLALSSVDLAWILLLNPNRLQGNTDLSIDAVMEEYLSLDRGWVTNLFFYHRGGKLEFGYRWNRRAYFDCGAAVADTSKPH
jgi:hypothetical protein